MARRFKISIRTILLSMVLLLGAVPLILMHTIINRSVKSNTLENTTLLTQGILNQSQNYLNLLLSELSFFYENIAQNRELIEMLESEHISESVVERIVEQKNIYASHSQVVIFDLQSTKPSLYIGSDNRVQYLHKSSVEGFLKTQHALLLMENSDRVLWVGTAPQDVDNIHNSIWNYRLLDTGTNRFFIIISIDHILLKKFIIDLQETINSDVRLVTSDNIIFPKDRDFFNYTFAPNTLSRSEKGRFIDFIDSRKVDGRKEELLVQLYSDPVYFYNLIVLTPQKNLLSGFEPISRTTTTTLLLLSLFSIGFGIMGILLFQKRIKEFISGLRGVSKGVYSIKRLDSRVIIKEDETLTDAIVDLSDEVSSSREELSSINEDLERRVKERTDELKLTRDSLIHSEKMAALGHNAAKITHEINNPLSVSITASSHLTTIIKELKNKFDNGELTRSYFKNFSDSAAEVSSMLHHNLERASELSNSFKNFASDQSSDELRDINLNNYIKEIIKSYTFKLRNTSYVINFHSVRDIKIKTYPAIIYQSITNLVNNSLLHGFEGREQGIITISLTEESEFYQLSIKDDGVGITPENQIHLFQPFFTTKQGEGGTGLGLNIIRDLIENKLHGSIECKSSLSSGTMFIIRLSKGGESD